MFLFISRSGLPNDARPHSPPVELLLHVEWVVRTYPGLWGSSWRNCPSVDPSETETLTDDLWSPPFYHKRGSDLVALLLIFSFNIGKSRIGLFLLSSCLCSIQQCLPSPFLLVFPHIGPSSSGNGVSDQHFSISYLLHKI